eukprot:TRINITY_DN2556_c0_g1_i1.p1 TRINITY_DN2556_c0_g1~~TRINITY_DN2556_c0_g1_i1.p1  ORF type:complete len:628 (+),score=295.92 TRINITY_DN2556_c0_g1_i1:54-1886(+)
MSNSSSPAASRSPSPASAGPSHLTIVVFGASGDLAKKKTYPALFSLYQHRLLPRDCHIIGFARSKMTDEDFKKKISQSFKGSEEEKSLFLDKCSYFAGQYDQPKHTPHHTAMSNSSSPAASRSPSPASAGPSHLTIVVFGASGDLAKKKTYPALFSLYQHRLLPRDCHIIGFARSKMTDEDFKKKISQSFKGSEEEKSLFLDKCSYFAGQYDSTDSMKQLVSQMSPWEKEIPGNRIFYMAIPPSIFYPVAKVVKEAGMSQSGWNRIIVEKPFGRDLESSDLLAEQLNSLFTEDQLYRIDHYLGKEMVQNLMGLRFANSVFEPLWNRNYIKSVTITFKEDIGTEGRGGYFDEFGIIRDVMQNHLLQIFSLVAMEPPVSLKAEDVQNEKVKLLKSTSKITLEDIVVGQFTKSEDGSKPGYLDDETVPKGSICPTYALAVLHVNNSRWMDVPFIFKSGKALEEKKSDIRIQFKESPTGLFSPFRNELVLRVQPNEAVYLKMAIKKPGLSNAIEKTELDLTYKDRHQGAAHLPDAYERLIHDVIRGDHNLFVRGDELRAAWEIFTPILHQLEKDKIQPIQYAFGTRGPAEADKLVKKYGYSRDESYSYKKQSKF